VDDASTDGSPDLARAFPGVKVIELSQNGGFARAVNHGIRESRGEIIALLNNDAVADHGWLEALVAALVRHARAGSAAAKVLLVGDPPTLNSAGDLFRRSGVPDNRGAWERDVGQYDVEIEVFGASAAAAAYRRTMLDDIGLFDESFFMYCEDVDLAFRAQLAGYRCVYAPKAVVRHRLSATGGGELASYQCGRNFVWLLARDVPGIVWRRHWRAILGTQLALAGRTLRHTREPAARARLRGQLVGLLSAPRLMLERGRFHRKRRVSDDYILGLLA
jgi:GT2 family glycosyltransferase